MATLTQVAGQLYDSGTHDPAALVAALVKKTAVSALAAQSAAAAVIAAKSKSGASTVLGAINPLDGFSDAVGVARDALDTPIRITKWLTEGGTWLRIGYGVLGMITILAGVQMIAIKPLVKVAETVGGVLPVGKAAKVVGAATKVGKTIGKGVA